MHVSKPNKTYYGDLVTGVTGPASNVYTATLKDGMVVLITDADTAVLVGDFAYFSSATGVEQRNPTWLHASAAEYAKWML